MRQTEVRPGPGDGARPGLAVRARAHRTTLAKVVLGVGGLLLLSACGEAPQSALDPAGPYAQGPHNLIRVVFIIAVVVFALVQGLIVYSVVKYRRRPDDDSSLPVQVHGNTRLEILWTVIPALILAGIAVPTVQGIFSQTDDPGEGIVIEVVGHRWWWEYTYPVQDELGIEEEIYTANELVIPVGVPVRLEMTAADNQRSPDRGVIHSYWIPALNGKQDVVPGQTTYLNLQADAAGRYLGQCGEYCGLSHVNMRNRAVALDEAEWQQWLEDQSQPAPEPAEGSLEAQGRALFEDLGPGEDGEDRPACIQCHQVYTEGGDRSPGQGPDLTHLFSREEMAGATLPLDEPTLRAWLADPPALKPMQYESNGIGMPDLGLSEDEIDALVAYLMTLQ